MQLITYGLPSGFLASLYEAQDEEDLVSAAKLYDAYDGVVYAGSPLLTHKLREATRSLLVVLDDKNNPNQRVFHMKEGADYCLPLPTAEEVEACLSRGLIRMNGGSDKCIRAQGITLNLETREVFKNGVPVKIQGKVYPVLECLMTRLGRIVSREAIYDWIYNGNGYAKIKTIDTHLCMLRHVIGHDVIETVRGEGYRIQGDLRW